jgi:photosystem II stability/assembly factor-like uncharacterized protein
MPRLARPINCVAWLRCVLLLPLLGAIAAACSSVAPSSVPTARPEVTLIAAATPVPPPPAYPIATLTAALAPASQSTIQLVRRVDALHGWALAGQRLRWTDDDGAHWRTIAVPLTERQSIANAFFLDARNGWLIVAGSHDTVKLAAQFSVLRTRDGGATWEAFPLTHYTDCYNCLWRGTGDILSGGERDSLMFLNEREGWSQIDRTETMNSFHADIFHTTDGGRTWLKLPSVFASGAFAFHTPRDGWQLGACCTGAPDQIQQTHDGGQTWQVVEFPDTPDYEVLALPTFFDAAAGVLPVAILDTQSNDTGRVVFYSTRDGGQTWRVDTSFDPQPVKSIAFPLGLPAFQAIDRDAWLLGVGRVIYQTANAGQSWRTVSNPAEPADFIRFMFADADHGWSIALKQGCEGSCAVLMRTSDGGRGWKPIDLFEE